MTSIINNFILIFTFIKIIETQIQIGDPCIFSYDSSSGKCTYTNDCRILRQLQKYSIKPNICSYASKRVPIICCPINLSRPVVPGNDNSANDYYNRFTTPYDDSAVVFPDDSAISLNNRLRKSDLKCKEYSKLVTNYIEPLPLLPSAEATPIAVPKCNFNGITLIVGGSKAKAKEFPHMAAIGYNVDGEIMWQCGGTLISEFYVVTAAHCTNTRDGGPPIRIRLGDLNLESNDDGGRPVNYGVSDIITHPRYEPPKKYNDIALIRLSRQVKFNDYIRPACLWTKPHVNYTRTVATGWGQTSFVSDASPHLLKVGLDIIDNNRCQRYYQVDDRILPEGIISSMICSGVLTGGKDTCLGDSGGPISVSSDSNKCLFYIIGVTSFGKGCGASNSPGVYTRISSYIDWIERIVWP